MKIYTIIAVALLSLYGLPAYSEDLVKDMDKLKNEVQQLRNQNFQQQHEIHRQQGEIHSYIQQQENEKRKENQRQEEIARSRRQYIDEPIPNVGWYIENAGMQSDYQVSLQMYFNLLRQNEKKYIRLSRQQLAGVYSGIIQMFNVQNRYTESYYYCLSARKQFPNDETIKYLT